VLLLRFLGVGNAQAVTLGNASAVLEIDGRPRLLIDCGASVPDAYRHSYARDVPEAIFITHTHFDHIAGLEPLFYRLAVKRQAPLVKLFVPASIVERLHQVLGNDPMRLAEGGRNFWDCFQLLPVGDQFWHAGLSFDVFDVQHHAYRSAYGLSLRSAFLYSGDTRPVPQVLQRFAANGEVVFHDCALNGNPSHSGVDDLERRYSPEQRSRLVLYHYESSLAGEQLRARGYRIAAPNQVFRLDSAEPERRLPASA
jgi:ribonuclease BN (tRNA processing enzyme)